MRVWHGRMLEGVRTPDPAWAGCFRGSACALDIEVFLPQPDGLRCYGSRAERVAGDLALFGEGLTRASRLLDRTIHPGEVPSDLEGLEAVLALAASAHARWVRIHPFVNGNGRTARLWANWVAIRYGLPRFIRLRPRPEGESYAEASREALCSGGPGMTREVFRAMYLAAMG